MDSNRLRAAAPGRLVPTGVPTPKWSFVPQPLPPAWDWDPDLWPLLDRANSSIARLDGIGATLPDPELLLRPLQHREAQTSSRLEGTIARPEQVLLFELEDDESPGDDPGGAAREVFNYGRALRLPRGARGLPLSLRLIRELHATLLAGVRGADSDPGQFRRRLVQIGRPARFVLPPMNELPVCLDSFERYLHERHRFPPLVESFLVHYQFEAIHPFLDGNGRVGRLLLALCVQDWCNLDKPWLHLSPYFEKHKDRYFDLLFRVSAEAAWSEWIRFCLEGVVSEATDAAERCKQLLSLRDAFSRRIHETGSRGSTRLIRAAEDLFRVPVVTVTGHARRCEVTYPTAKSDLETLVSLGILTELEGTRQRTFAAADVLRVIYD